MRFLVGVMAITLAMSLNGFAQKGSTKSHEAKNEPKSTVAVKTPKGKAGGSSSKELQKIEHEKAPKSAHANKRTPRAATVKATKDSRGSGINFNNRGGKGTGTSARGGSSLKGRLKEKGKTKQQ